MLLQVTYQPMLQATLVSLVIHPWSINDLTVFSKSLSEIDLLNRALGRFPWGVVIIGATIWEGEEALIHRMTF